MLLEIACFNFESAQIAQRAGANRVELCENYTEGGITPSPDLIQKVKKELFIPVFVMIRPRPGKFIYSEEEFRVMKQQVLFCKEQNCDGIVFGILTSDNEIDRRRCKELVGLAKPLPCTFHRAFDELDDVVEGLEQLISLGFSRILTSGKAKNAVQGSKILSELVEKSAGRITIIAGGGIRASNCKEIITNTGVKEVHSAAITDNSGIANEDEIRALLKLF
jgi:copper homeostasis protein